MTNRTSQHRAIPTEKPPWEFLFCHSLLRQVELSEINDLPKVTEIVSV